VSSGVAALGDAASEYRALVAEALGGEPEFESQFGEIATTQIAELDVLELVPDPFVGIGFGRIAGQLLQVEPGGRALREKVRHGLGPVDGCAIPDHEQRARLVVEQMAQEADHLGAAERLLADLHQ
jgi:hypothetical protein